VKIETNNQRNENRKVNKKITPTETDAKLRG
jgi:hypothetical protein